MNVLMKILFLNHHVDAQHKIVQALKARGIALLLPANSDEALQVLGLHASSVDLAILHREGFKGGDPGVELLHKIKKDPAQADLPIIFTSETWSADQCAKHQNTPLGANAYLCWPFSETDLLNTIDSIFGPEEGSLAAEAAPVAVAPPPPADASSIDDIVLQPEIDISVSAVVTPPVLAAPPSAPSAKKPPSMPPAKTAPPAPPKKQADISLVMEAPKLEAPKAGEFILEDPADFLGAEVAGDGPNGIALEMEASPEEKAAAAAAEKARLDAIAAAEKAKADAEAERIAARKREPEAIDLSSIELSMDHSLQSTQQPPTPEGPEIIKEIVAKLVVIKEVPVNATGQKITTEDPSVISLAPESPEGDDALAQQVASGDAFVEEPFEEAPAQEIGVDAPMEISAESSSDHFTENGNESGDSALEQEMPYLFKDDARSQVGKKGAVARSFVHPVGDAVVPGGAVNAPDMETLKKYLNLREQDVAALSVQLRAARDELATVKTQLSAEQSHSEEMQFIVSDQKRKIEDFERERALALEGVQAELSELRFQNKMKADKAKILETQVKEASSEIERLKERVRSDIRKIRVRERELENKLEITKKDSEAILTSRENKIIELKRKLDLLEFNMDLLQDRYAREKDSSTKLREKLSKAAQVVRVAEGLLDEPGAANPNPSESTQAS
jgi:hypothetical protein